jgi:hypothetical protein
VRRARRLAGLRGPSLVISLAVVLGASSGCGFRLSDGFYAFKDIHADEPSREGRSLIIGTIVVESWMAGDLDSVSLIKFGPGERRSHVGADQENLFRVFRPRAIKDGHFIVEVPPGLYEVERFVTSRLGRVHRWSANDEARRNTRIVVTRPGVYDLGTIRVVRGDGAEAGYGMERLNDNRGARRVVFARALAGTKWQALVSAAASAEDGDAAPPSGGGE